MVTIIICWFVSAVTTILCGLKISCSEIMVQTINNLVNAQKINLGSVWWLSSDRKENSVKLKGHLICLNIGI